MKLFEGKGDLQNKGVLELKKYNAKFLKYKTCIVIKGL